jgi:hypothetical protein
MQPSWFRLGGVALLATMTHLTAAELPAPYAPAPVTVSGTTWELDDALFHGPYHDAFEGLPQEQPDGTWKSGPQGIQRTKGVLTGQGTGHAEMTLRIRLEQPPAAASTLRLTGLNDHQGTPHPVRVTLNGQVLAEGLTFPANRALELKLNQRYYVGWAERPVAVPAGLLRAGDNELVIANTTDAFAAASFPYVAVDVVRWDFAAATSATVTPPPEPVLYYGLREGVETHLWPVAATTDEVTLLAGLPIAFTFFATLPRELPLGTQGPLKGEPTRPNREILLHVWTTAPVTALGPEGEPLTSAALAGGRLFVRPLDRLINYETPHPSQGAGLMLQAEAPFVDATLRAWYTVDGVAYRPRDYPLRAVALPPLAGRDKLDFQLSLWGGGAPEEPAALASHIALLQAAGFNHAFTGEAPTLNQALRAAGFRVHPRFGWFGHGMALKGDDLAFAAVSAQGQPQPKDACPLAILEHPDHPELGKYFARARQFAAQPAIDGLCVDYETAPVWCWCDRCLALFRQETGATFTTRAELADEAPLAAAYRDFGRRRNRDLLARVKHEMQQVNPKLEYLALASAADLPAYWYDPRGARHSIRELATFADAIYASIYCYEVPGGLKSVLPSIATVQQAGVRSGRQVGACMITPVATTISEFPRYRSASLRPDFTRLIVLLAALGGGKGISFFRGDCFDGAQYAAVRQAVDELLQLQPYLAARLDRSAELDVQPAGDVKLRFETEIAEHLLSRFTWRPQPQYFHDHVQLLRDATGRDRLIALFNYASGPLELRVRCTGLQDDRFAWHDALTGEALGAATRPALEGPGATFTVPPHSCRLLRLTTTE